MVVVVALNTRRANVLLRRCWRESVARVPDRLRPGEEVPRGPLAAPHPVSRGSLADGHCALRVDQHALGHRAVASRRSRIARYARARARAPHATLPLPLPLPCRPPFHSVPAPGVSSSSSVAHRVRSVSVSGAPLCTRRGHTPRVRVYPLAGDIGRAPHATDARSEAESEQRCRHF